MGAQSESRLGWLNLGVVGVSASTICAIHCAVTPLVLTSLPFLGLGFLTDPWFEGMMTAVAVGIGMVSLVPEYLRHHRRPQALVLLGVGAAAMTAGQWLRGHEFETFLMIGGGLTLASAYVVNWRLCRHAKPTHHVVNMVPPRS